MVKQRNFVVVDLVVTVDKFNHDFGKLHFLLIAHRLEHLDSMLALQAVCYNKRVVVNFKLLAHEVESYHLLIGDFAVGIGHLYEQAHYCNLFLIGEVHDRVFFEKVSLALWSGGSPKGYQYLGS